MTRVLVCATSDFAIPALESLLASSYQVVGVITQPDRAAGRSLRPQPTPVKQWLTKQQIRIPLYQPERLRSQAADILAELRPELIVVAAYGQFIPQEMLSYPQHGCLNIHGSLLPALRGAVPVQMAILQGLSRTGVSIQRMVQAMDAGPLIGQQDYPLTGQETSGELTQALAKQGAQLLLQLLPRYLAGEIVPVEQDHSLATYCYQREVSKERAEIVFSTSMQVAERMVRAFNPSPVTWVKLKVNGRVQTVRIWRASPTGVSGGETELKIVRQGKSLLLALQDGYLLLEELQLAGKDRRNPEGYLFLAD